MRLYPEVELPVTPATYENTRTTGFQENFSQAWNKAIKEDLSISSLIPTEIEQNRNQKLMDYHKAGQIPQKDWEFYGRDMDKLAQYARDTLGLEDIPTNEEYERRVQEEYRGVRLSESQVSSQAGFKGKAGSFLGATSAFLADPLRMVSVFTGAIVNSYMMFALFVISIYLKNIFNS